VEIYLQRGSHHSWSDRCCGVYVRSSPSL